MLLAGPLFTALMIATLALEGTAPSEKASAATVIQHYTDHEAATVAVSFLLGPAAAVLLVFVSRLRAAIDDRARAARSLLVAGGTIVAGGLVLCATVFNSSLWLPIVIGLAAMLFGAGLAVLRTGILPAWLGWVAVVVGVVSLLGPGGFLGFFVAPVWVGVAGVLLYLRKPVGTDVVL